MAFYRMKFEGNEYCSKDMYERVFKVGVNGILAKSGFKTIFATGVVGPLKAEEIKVLDAQIHTYFDIDACIKNFAPPSTDQKCITVPVCTENLVVHAYKEMRFLQLNDVMDSRKYRLLPQMPVVRITGSKNVYVALDVVNKELPEPVILTEV